MRTYLIRGAIIVLVGMASFVVAGRARGDSCVGASSVAGMNDKWKVDGAFDEKAKAWSYVLTNRKTGEKRSGPLVKFEWHAHLYFFVNDNGTRFAVLDASAGHQLNDRFLVYDSKGRLLEALGVPDILNEEEQKKVQHSISHIDWLKYDPKAKSYGEYVSKQNGVRLTTRSDREVLISLKDGKLIKPGQ